MNYLNEIPEELIRMYVGTILYKANIQTNANTCWAIIKQNWTLKLQLITQINNYS